MKTKKLKKIPFRKKIKNNITDYKEIQEKKYSAMKEYFSSDVEISEEIKKQQEKKNDNLLNYLLVLVLILVILLFLLKL